MPCNDAQCFCVQTSLSVTYQNELPAPEGHVLTEESLHYADLATAWIYNVKVINYCIYHGVYI